MILSISIHAPTRGATNKKVANMLKSKFQSTLPREERHKALKLIVSFYQFQSTLPREERLLSALADIGRTIFQSTLPREERPMPFTFFTRFKYFNPRSHERSDVASDVDFTLSYRISIHAPTRGATIAFLIIGFAITISIHAPTRGATLILAELDKMDRIFQSTLPREVRFFYLRLIEIIKYFNPRSQERIDYATITGSSPKVISIHAPTRGATSWQ